MNEREPERLDRIRNTRPIVWLLCACLVLLAVGEIRRRLDVPVATNPHQKGYNLRCFSNNTIENCAVSYEKGDFFVAVSGDGKNVTRQKTLVLARNMGARSYKYTVRIEVTVDEVRRVFTTASVGVDKSGVPAKGAEPSYGASSEVVATGWRLEDVRVRYDELVGG